MRAVSVLSTSILCALVSFSAHAGKPTDGDGNFVGNGYPSGPHFNLNIHGKGDTFQCPEPDYYLQVTVDGDPTDGISVGDLVKDCPAGYTCVETTEQYYGNVINLPRDGSEVQIYVESGRKGPKSAPDATTLEVTDWCTQPFDSDAASFRLPADPDGYAVYSRVTGKPVDDQYFEVFGRQLTTVEIECTADDLECPTGGVYDLLLLGVVNEDGAFVPVGNGDGNFERVDANDGRGGKGVKNATDVTGMFEFTGNVCYVYADDPACTGDTACTATSYCCPVDDVTLESAGACLEKQTDTFWDADLGTWSCSVLDGFDADGAVASLLWLEEEFYCRSYEDQWIFNIADFVGVLFDVRNNDSYNIKLRFYPLPLQESKQKK
jgi:hypothetical protein